MTKKTRITADDVLRQMYPDLPTSDDLATKQNGTTDNTDASAKTIAELQAQIARLEGVVSGRGESRQALKTATQDTPPAAPVHNYDQAPDPAVDPKGYAAFVLAESKKDVEYEKQLYMWQQRQAQSQAGKVNSLWSDFTEQYEDYAKDQTKVEVAATRVAERARAKGIDVDSYMYGNSGQFMKDVVSEIDKLWPKAAATDNDEDDEDEDDNRASFVSPQGAATGAKPKAHDENNQKYGALGQAIVDWQEKTGMHR